MKGITFLCAILLPLICLAPTNNHTYSNKELAILRLQNSELTLQNVKQYIQLKDIQHPDKVLAQFVLETGWGTSYVCKTFNNLFGFMKYSKKEGKYVYFRYNHWTESIDAYKRFQARKYKGGCYWNFLASIGYAEDSTYVAKLKQFKFKV